jgi:hypothetical protein
VGYFFCCFPLLRAKVFLIQDIYKLNGDISKPIPTIRFYLPGSKYIFEKNDPSGYFIQIEVDEKLLDSIQRCIENGNLSMIKLPSQTLSILFICRRNRDMKMLESINQDSVRIVFDKIINLFDRTDKKGTINRVLDTILSRFIAEITH